MTVHPEVRWAQRSSPTDETKNLIYLIVNLPDIKGDTLTYELTPTKISFKTRAGDASKGLDEKDYEFSFDLFAEVDVEKSTKKLSSRSFDICLRKKVPQQEYWPRLTKDKTKHPHVKTDFDKWVDEDEQDGNAKEDWDETMGDDFGDMGGMPGMGGMGGMPGMGGMGGMPGMGGMGGMPGLEGMGGGMDFEKMMEGIRAKDSASGSHGADNDDEDDDGPPPLEDAGKP